LLTISTDLPIVRPSLRRSDELFGAVTADFVNIVVGLSRIRQDEAIRRQRFLVDTSCHLQFALFCSFLVRKPSGNARLFDGYKLTRLI